MGQQWAAACRPPCTAAAWCGCVTCRSVAGRWSSGGASASGAWWRTLDAWKGLPRWGWMRPASSRRPAWRPPSGSLAWWTWTRAGCWMWWPTVPGPPWTAGLVPGPLPGWPASVRWRWTPGAGMPARGTAGPLDRGGGSLPRHPAGQRGGRPGPPSRAAGHAGHRGRARSAVPDPQAAADGRRAVHRAGLTVGDPRPGRLAAAWQGKELLRAIYASDGRPAARAALERFYRWADGIGLAELSRLARTVRAWEGEILAWHATQGCSNGPTEAVNLLIKKVKRVGHGFRKAPRIEAGSQQQSGASVVSRVGVCGAGADRPGPEGAGCTEAGGNQVPALPIDPGLPGPGRWRGRLHALLERTAAVAVTPGDPRRYGSARPR